MYHLYKGLHILYWTIGGLCIVTAAVWALFYPKQAVCCAILMSVIIISSMIILSLIAKRRFKDEVMSSLYNCHTREYLEKLDFRMKKNKRALNNMGTLSLYNCLPGLD